MELTYSLEIRRAKEFLSAAKKNLELKDEKTAANRLYLSAERAIVALLNKKFKKETPKNHRKIWNLSKKLDLGINTYYLLRELYDLRLQGDYGANYQIVELNLNERLLNEKRA